MNRDAHSLARYNVAPHFALLGKGMRPLENWVSGTFATIRGRGHPSSRRFFRSAFLLPSGARSANVKDTFLVQSPW